MSDYIPLIPNVPRPAVLEPAEGGPANPVRYATIKIMDERYDFAATAIAILIRDLEIKRYEFTHIAVCENIWKFWREQNHWPASVRLLTVTAGTSGKKYNIIPGESLLDHEVMVW